MKFEKKTSESHYKKIQIVQRRIASCTKIVQTLEFLKKLENVRGYEHKDSQYREKQPNFRR